MKQLTCATCQAYAFDRENPEQGWCHNNPPVLSAASFKAKDSLSDARLEVVQTTFPRVPGYFWCRQHSGLWWRRWFGR